MRKPARMVLWVVAAVIFFSPALLVSIAGAQAKSVTAIEGVKFDVQYALVDNLKLFTGKDWIWFILPFEPVKLSRFPAAEGWVRQNPMVVNRDNRWQLHFPFEKKTKLPDKDFKRPVLSIDLGINCTATASVMASDGTVLHRAFIDYGREKDLLKTTIGRIAGRNKASF